MILGLNPSLQNKITLLVCAITLCTATSIGLLNYLRTVESSRNMAIELMASETRLTAQQFKGVFDNMQNDLFVVAGTPPIKELIRSVTYNETNPLNDSNTTLWRARLETIFSSIMTKRLHYTQMRYIGFAEGGQELVRVDRTKNKLHTIPLEKLQKKGSEPYMQDIELFNDGQIYFSDVTYNREENKIDPNLTPTLRASMAVYDENDNLFGILIINANYVEMISKTIKEASPAHNAFVINNLGDFIEYEVGGNIKEFEFHENYSTNPPSFIRRIHETNVNEADFEEGETISHFVKMNIPHRSSTAFVGTVLRRPTKEVMVYANKIRNETLLIGILLVLASTLLSYIITKNLFLPLRKMTESVRASKDYKKAIDLPVYLKDEIGELARSLQKATAKLQESEAKSNAILDKANDGVITIDEKGIIDIYNKASEKIFGYTSDEVLGKNIKMLMPEPVHSEHDQYLNHYQKTLKKTIIGVSQEVRGQRKDGTTFSMNLSVSEVYINDRQIFTGIIRDLTLIKQEEAERERLIKALEHSNKELDEFAYVASHDLKAPLRVIDNASKWLAEDLDEYLDDDSRENLQLLQSRVKRMEKLLDDLLEYSRIGRKLDDRYKEVVSGKELMDDIRMLLSPPENFTLKADSNFNKLKVNKMPIKQILRNLINNAIKHHHKDNGNITVTLEESLEAYKCLVTDDGPGIQEQYKIRIFEMFQTLKPRDQVEGSGMGLAIIKKHMEHLNGEIGVESKEGHGSTFWFSWPKNVEYKIVT